MFDVTASWANLRWLFAIQGLSPLDDLARFPAPVQTHIRSPCVAAAPISRVRRAGLQEDGTILIRGFSSQPWNRFVHLDLPGLIRSQEITESG